MNRCGRQVGLVVLLFFFLTLLMTPEAAAFSDVKDHHWAKSYIDYLTSRGIASGYGDGTYRPNKGVTRAEFAVLLIKALNMEDSAWALEGGQRLFRDVPESFWAQNYIQLAWELGIVGGYADGTFRPEQTIRRDEMVSMLVRALRFIGQGQNQLEFVDESSIPQWARESVRLAARWGLVSGFEDGTFRPAVQVTRAQAAVFIKNFLEQRGTDFDLTAVIKSIDPSTKQLTVELEGETVNFTYTGSLAIYKNNKAVSLDSLAIDLPVRARLLLNKQGQVNFVELGRVSSSSVALSLGKIPSPASAGGSVALRQAGLLERSLEEEVRPLTGALSRAKRSLEITKEAMEVPQLVDDLQVDGRGQVVAIIDSGIDPLHPDLLKTTKGQEKVLNFIDLTSEGLVLTSGTVKAQSTVTIEDKTYLLGNIPTKSGVYHYGFFREEELGFDVNFNGSTHDKFLVLVTDGVTKGRYDTLYIDTNLNGSLADETPLKVYSQGFQKVGFHSYSGKGRFNFVVCEIAEDGSQVKLGFDINGHGTQVAGVAAANGAVRGVAPGAQLLIIKVLDKQGQTTWERLEEAIRLAVAQGATVVNLSLGYYGDVTWGNNSLTYLIDTYSQRGVVFTVAVGNEGPGMASITTPGNARGAIGVGAYIAPAMWKHDFGYEVPENTLWYFSSAGPRQDGLVAPAVVAPGSAVTTYPTWSGSNYRLAEGTSIAAPHVAGAVALLLEGAEKNKVEVTPEKIKRAVQLGAQPLEKYSVAEAGYGIFNAPDTWKHLRRLGPQAPLKSYTWNRQLGIGVGIYAREFLPGQVPFRVGNAGTDNQIVFWQGSAEWLKPWFKMTSLPRGSQRDIPVDYVLPEKPGLYTAFLEGRYLDSYGPEVAMLTTVLKPYYLTEDNGYRMIENHRLGAGHYQRYFLRVPEGAEAMELILAVPQASGSYQGRVRMHIFTPDGQEYMMSDFAGKALGSWGDKEWVGTTIENPSGGTWEVVVYSSPALSQLGLSESQYTFRAQLMGVSPEKESSRTSQYLIGLPSKPLQPGELNYISLSLRDKNRKTPVDGIMIEINGQIYQVKNGWVTFTAVPQSEKLKLEIRL